MPELTQCSDIDLEGRVSSKNVSFEIIINSWEVAKRSEIRALILFHFPQYWCLTHDNTIAQAGNWPWNSPQSISGFHPFYKHSLLCVCVGSSMQLYLTCGLVWPPSQSRPRILHDHKASCSHTFRTLPTPSLTPTTTNLLSMLVILLFKKVIWVESYRIWPFKIVFSLSINKNGIFLQKPILHTNEHKSDSSSFTTWLFNFKKTLSREEVANLQANPSWLVSLHGKERGRGMKTPTMMMVKMPSVLRKAMLIRIMTIEMTGASYWKWRRQWWRARVTAVTVLLTMTLVMVTTLKTEWMNTLMEGQGCSW